MSSSLSVRNSNKRYLILTYRVEYDRVHYPLPLAFEEVPSVSSLQRVVRRLRKVSASWLGQYRELGTRARLRFRTSERRRRGARPGCPPLHPCCILLAAPLPRPTCALPTACASRRSWSSSATLARERWRRRRRPVGRRRPRQRSRRLKSAWWRPLSSAQVCAWVWVCLRVRVCDVCACV